MYTEEYVDCDICGVIYDIAPQQTRWADINLREKTMPTFNRTFELSINDIDLIEEALRARGRELCTMRRALGNENPAEMSAIRVIEQDQREGEKLLGKLHDQKIFYRPEGAVYVGG